MNHLTEAYVDSLALNSSAIKNGKDLVKKNSFPLLCQSEDGTIIFGECKEAARTPINVQSMSLKKAILYSGAHVQAVNSLASTISD